MILKLIGIIVVISFYDEMEKAREKKELHNVVYWGTLLITAFITIWR